METERRHMARARNIKPSFFTNDVLAQCSDSARLVFIGLWCIADREGRLEDRPMRIKAELMPYSSCDMDDLLRQLTVGEFITRYEIDGRKYIQVNNFTKHQHPHVKEGASTIPAPDLSGAKTSDSLLPITDSLLPHTENRSPGRGRAAGSKKVSVSKSSRKPAYDAAFEAWYAIYPRHVGKGEASAAYGRAIKRLSDSRECSPSDAHLWLIGVTQTFADSPAGTAGSYTPHPATWLNQARYEDDPQEWLVSGGTAKAPPPTATRLPTPEEDALWNPIDGGFGYGRRAP